MIMFDIDGTILDMRYMIVHVLKAYDSEHGTDLFHGLTIWTSVCTRRKLEKCSTNWKFVLIKGFTF